RSLKVAVFGYAMNQMGDIRVDENALLRSLGPQIDFLAPGELWRRMQAIGSDEIAALRQWEDRTFDVDPRLSEAERNDHARMQLGIESLLTDGGYHAYSAHFDAIGQDGRFARLP